MDVQKPTEESEPPHCDKDRLDRVEEALTEATAEVREAKTDLARAEDKLEQAVEELEGDGKTVIIVVDGTPHEVPKHEHITYAEVVTLAYPDYPQHPEITYSVTYTHGPRHNPEGILPPGGSVKVKEGMAFRVNRTGQS